MKCNLLVLLCLCLLPIVAFSSTFISQNPIELPTDNDDKLVRDVTGKALDADSSYRIVSTAWGAAGGDVYLGYSPNSKAPCKDGVFRYNSDRGPRGTPVKFIKSANFTFPGIFENLDHNIKFDIATNKLCVSYTIWKVGDYDEALGAKLLETGGTIDLPDSSWFKIVKDPILSGYNLLHCPDHDVCQGVGQVFQHGRRRLALVKGFPLSFNFEKVYCA